MVKNLPANAGDLRDVDLIPGSGRFPWRRTWQPTPVFLKNFVDRGAWQVTDHGVAKSWTQLKLLRVHVHACVHTHTHTHTIFRSVILASNLKKQF